MNGDIIVQQAPHCCDCAKSEDETNILQSLIEAAGSCVVFNDDVPREERESLEPVYKAARAFLMAMWERKTPRLEMPKL